MITIIHGDDLTLSRNYFLDLKRKQSNAILFSGEKITITDLVQNIEGSTLFGINPAIFIEEFLTKLKRTNEAKEILDFIVKNKRSSAFILWESKEISKRELFLFRDSIVKIFKLPKNIFLFLDNLRPNNSKNLLNLFHRVLESGIKEELLLFMLQRQIRILLALSEQGDNEPIEELTRLAPWQMGKLQRQAKSFDLTDLKKTYQKLYEMEISQKTGTLPLSVSQSIDFLLLEM